MIYIAVFIILNIQVEKTGCMRHVRLYDVQNLGNTAYLYTEHTVCKYTVCKIVHVLYILYIKCNKYLHGFVSTPNNKIK